MILKKRTNDERVERITTALSDYLTEQDGAWQAQPVQALADAVTDLMHYATAHGLDIEATLTEARGHYTAEVLVDVDPTLDPAWEPEED
jgi:hypothetical protein